MFTIGLAVASLAACSSSADTAEPTLDPAVYLDKAHGSWAAAMVANHTGLPREGVWLETPDPGSTIEWVLLDEWSTDDDTHVEWLGLHILETHGLEPSNSEIRDEWVDHLNGDIWVATRRARDLMDEGVLPPETGATTLNPDGAWSMDAQLETELFGLIAPGDASEARRRARRFAMITNRGPAVDASAFYAQMYAEAFFDREVATLISFARAREAPDSTIAPIVDDVRRWHAESPDDWRVTRANIAAAYDTDPSWWGSRVNFATTIMALLYGDGDLIDTVTIAGLAGWDADNNMTTAAGLLGVIIGYESLPEPFASASDVYVNVDLTGDLPAVDSVRRIAERTVALGTR